MSEALRPVTNAAVAAMDKIVAYTENPFRALPDDWIPLVATFMMAKGNLVGTPTSFCMLVTIQKSKGLTLTGLKAVLGRLTDAEVAAKHNFANQLLADFHGLCALAIRNQKQHDERKRMREAEAKPDSSDGTILKFTERTRFASADEHTPLPPLPQPQGRRKA